MFGGLDPWLLLPVNALWIHVISTASWNPTKVIVKEFFKGINTPLENEEGMEEW